MTSRIGLLVLGLLCLPMSVSAAVVNIEFSAHVYSTTGDGFGYEIGDLISGTYLVDTSKAQGKAIDEANEVWYTGAVDSGLLESSFAIDTGIDYSDFVNVFNHPGSDDQLALTKVISAYGFMLDSLGISFQFPGLDWISDLSLNNINIVSNEGSYSNGGFARFDMNTWNITDSANFWLDSVKITSSSVPEPAPLILLSIAMAALIGRRRFI